MPRLYVGGLSHSVTQKDLTDRFGKFGKVEDVELRTRRDDEGVPYKTFAYINLNISDKDLKKCMTVLNKSKWKGGTLQIEPAKESLLHKLAQERQMEQQRPLQDADDKHPNACKLLESLSKAGVDNFTMKAAVPGTEIPGHKDWVVSKFGRVLPVMQLRRRKGTVKYDPSKYCHNIRRLAPPTGAVDPPTPVAQLTWQMDGGDDDISKKRRGEFPPKPKKTRTAALESMKAVNNAGPAQVVGRAKLENRRPVNGFERPVPRRGRARYEDGDSEEEEMRRLLALERSSSHNAPGQDDNLEVVGDDYLVKSGGAWHKCAGRPMNGQEEDDYDSADTDELFASRERPLPPRSRQNGSGERTGTPKRKREELDDGEKEEEEDFQEASGKPSLPPPPNSSEERTETRDSREDDESSQEDQEEPLSADSDYEALFSNVTRLEISLADLRKLAEEPQLCQEKPAVPEPGRATLPEDILASLLADDSGEDQREAKKKKRRKVAGATLPAFGGTAALHREALEKTDEPENNTSDASSSSEEAKAALRRPRLSAREEDERQRRDDKRRLAAVRQRLKEAEEHKKLIQGALANLDAVTTRTGKHIVFDSDDEPATVAASETSPRHRNQSEEDAEAAPANESVAAKDEGRGRASGPRLFGSSEDEEEAEEEQDGGGFHIRPQFEGHAGQKLMELQSHFGTDERFRMDSRFLEEEEAEDNEEESGGKRSVAEDEELLQEEKRRNLSILQGLLGPQANSEKTAAKSKTFRDVSALHYDPSREEHAAFESKADGDKDSKATRRRKREEAQKLPEVSKEIFYDVSGDLKAMFGSAAEGEPAARPESSWDQEEEEEKDEEQPAQQEHGGFMFSFFGDDVQAASERKEYKAESIQTARVLPWQQDPRLQDSSEEEEEDEEEAQRDESNAAQNATAEIVSSANSFFFFRLDDGRLTDGPAWFCRSAQLEEEREEWEERRTQLRQEYRKKHKDARRKLKSSQKT